MPSSAKALLLQVNAFLANNNVRKNIGTFSINVQKDTADIRQISTVVTANGGTYTFAPGSGNKLTVISVSKPMLADVTFLNSGGFSQTINEILVLDTEVTQIVFTNQNLSDDAELVIING